MAAQLLLACAVANLGFAVFHVAFWRLFDWRDQLARVSWVNRGVMQVLNVRLIYVFVLFAALQAVFAPTLLASPPGFALQAGIAGFWAMRAAEQVLFFRLAHPASKGIFALFVANALLHAAALVAAGVPHA